MASRQGGGGPPGAPGGPRKRHVPYRESKLTRLLGHSLGGRGLAVLIICCSPLSSHYQETVASLRFGDRACKLVNIPAANNAIYNTSSLKEQLEETQRSLRMYEACLRYLRVAVGQQQQAIGVLQQLVPVGAPVTVQQISLLRKAAAAAKEAVLADAAAHFSGGPYAHTGDLQNSSSRLFTRTSAATPPAAATTATTTAAAAAAARSAAAAERRRSQSCPPPRGPLSQPVNRGPRGPPSTFAIDRSAMKGGPPGGPPRGPPGSIRAPTRVPQAAAARTRGPAAAAAAQRRKETGLERQRSTQAARRAAAARQPLRANGVQRTAAAATSAAATAETTPAAAAAAGEKLSKGDSPLDNEEASVNWLPQAKEGGPPLG